MRTHVPLNVDAGHRKGVTLLEVLIAGGILVVGLAGVAAILPAAGMMLSEAATADRAAALANNGFAELSRLGTFSSGNFSGNVTTVLAGTLFRTPSSFTANRTAYPFTFTANLTNTSTFNLVSPLGNGTATTRFPGPSAADRTAYGASWFGATATPLQSTRPLRPGASARVTVIVTQSAAPESDRVRLVAVTGVGGVYEIDSSPTAVGPLFSNQPLPSLRDDIRKRLLNGCAWVAVVNEAAGTVRWLRVANSWATYQPDGVTIKSCYVSFTDSSMTTTPLVAYAFQGVIRVEERIMQLAE